MPLLAVMNKERLNNRTTTAIYSCRLMQPTMAQHGCAMQVHVDYFHIIVVVCVCVFMSLWLLRRNK